MTKPREQVRDDGRQKERLIALIGERVIHTLGAPDGPHQVQVRRLWEDHYRVNIFIGSDVAPARVAHSYFLVTDGGGNIVAATPKITRQY